jgi:hypothetical protein
MMRLTLLLFACGLTASCGAYSILRPADNLKAGQAELAGGVSVNMWPLATFVGQGSVGITNWLELGGQYEVYSAEGWARFGLLRSEAHGVALALSAGGGAVWNVDLADEGLHLEEEWEPAILAGVTLGRRFGVIEPYLGWRCYYMPQVAYSLNAIKAGVRLTPVSWSWGSWWLGLEGGATIYGTDFTIAEGAAVTGFTFGG